MNIKLVPYLAIVLFSYFLHVDICLGQSRTWTSRDGKHKIEGVVERVDKEKSNVVLRLKDGTKRSVSISDLSKKDQTYISFKFGVTVDKDLRTWTSSKGKKIRAKLLKFENNKVYLQSPEGKNYAPIPLDRLSVADQDFVSPPRALQPTAAAKALKVSVDSTNSIGMQLKLLPAGTFMTGKGENVYQVKLTKPFLILAFTPLRCNVHGPVSRRQSMQWWISPWSCVATFLERGMLPGHGEA